MISDGPVRLFFHCEFKHNAAVGNQTHESFDAWLVTVDHLFVGELDKRHSAFSDKTSNSWPLAVSESNFRCFFVAEVHSAVI